MKQNNRNDMLITFLSAFAFLVYEVYLSRFFSVIMDYNFVFLAISLATLGIGLGGFLAYKSSGFVYRNRNEWLGVFAFLLIISVFVMYMLPYQNIWFYSIVALFPFCVGGSLLAAIMQGQREYIRAIYFSDLAGAGIGAIGSIWLMNVLGPLETIILISTALVLVSFAYSGKVAAKPIKLLCIVVLAVLIFNVAQPFSNFFSFRAYETSPANIFLGEKDVNLVFSEWNSFSRTDVYEAGDGELLYITIDGGAVSPISKYMGDLKQVDYLRTTTSYLAFQDVAKERVLIIGAGGGQEVLTAKMVGFEQIEAVDINSGSFRAVEALSSFSGNIFRQPGVQEVVSDGRNYIRKTQNQYDLIYLSLVKKESDNGLGMTLTENYIFTNEAVGEYLKKLKPNGRLAFLLHDEAELSKVMAAGEKSLNSEGVSNDQLSGHIAVIGTYQHLGHEVWGLGGSKITRPLLIISKEPFSLISANSLKSEAESIQQIPIHIPHVYDQFSPLSDLLAKQKINLAANSDDMPFFYNKTGEIPRSFMWIVVFTFLTVIILARKTDNGYGGTVYFSGIAIGFIIIETTLVQRLILPLGHPTLSFVLVLGVLLVAGGIGSLLSEKWFPGRTKRYAPLLIVTIIAVGVNSGITWYNEQMLFWPLAYRITAVVLLLFPLGFFMGMPFPYGLTRIPERQTAVSWAVNGLMTVSGSLLSVMISLTMGFTAAMMIGATVYGLLYFVQPKLDFT